MRLHGKLFAPSLYTWRLAEHTCFWVSPQQVKTEAYLAVDEPEVDERVYVVESDESFENLEEDFGISLKYTLNGDEGDETTLDIKPQKLYDAYNYEYHFKDDNVNITMYTKFHFILTRIECDDVTAFSKLKNRDVPRCCNNLGIHLCPHPDKPSRCGKDLPVTENKVCLNNGVLTKMADSDILGNDVSMNIDAFVVCQANALRKTSHCVATPTLRQCVCLPDTSGKYCHIKKNALLVGTSEDTETSTHDKEISKNKDNQTVITETNTTSLKTIFENKTTILRSTETSSKTSIIIIKSSKQTVFSNSESFIVNDDDSDIKSSVNLFVIQKPSSSDKFQTNDKNSELQYKSRVLLENGKSLKISDTISTNEGDINEDFNTTSSNTNESTPTSDQENYCSNTTLDKSVEYEDPTNDAPSSLISNYVK
ncbi:hypothetical protein RF11_15594 [Thelohanellus kitauei]|uniref:EGF-like domain-containing protein n=1 Tax=Thelohanellus kitauei TaxID=669202 RepID=A0A0C2MJK0_THEKT|nr:hypothetical protein RF11_15594 [Thelohanellus kitauei]